MALELFANSDALYHDVEPTSMVTLAGQEILNMPIICLHFT